MNTDSKLLDAKIRNTIASLGLDPSTIRNRDLPQYPDARTLVVAEYSASGRAHELIPEAASAWKELKAMATEQGVSLIIISAFRSFERQLEIVRNRIKTGENAIEVFRQLAPPGCSQHHTGRALDIGTFGCEPAAEVFESTQAFTWLGKHAADYGYTLSYPRDNIYGYSYEPWHWYYSAMDT